MIRTTVERKKLEKLQKKPVSSKRIENNILFLDFGEAAFGTLLFLHQAVETAGKMVIHLGEQVTSEGRVERSPQGTIRYRSIDFEFTNDPAGQVVVIAPDARNTGIAAIHMPIEIGEVFPFRYAEIETDQEIDPQKIVQVAVNYPFDDSASSFHSSSEILNRVWDLCKYTIKATTFCGIYVDGDRERIPYEGDAYLNQLSHYCVDSEYTLARYTYEYLIQYPTWPTEWQLHTVLMAWADYLYTGDLTSIKAFYDDLCVKTLVELAREDGLISTASPKCTREFETKLHFHNENYIFSHGLSDLVDWPPGSFTSGGTGERDNHEMLPINTVVNAFHYYALLLMSRIANALGKTDDEKRFAEQAAKVNVTMNTLLFDESQGCYVDGEGSNHASLHSNMFMLAFDIVPVERKERVLEFVKSRGMACSVYGAHYLLEALYLNNEDNYAFELMTATHDRSWWNMIKVGSTMTLEAWDMKYKNNLDWNHAWGAVPANIIPRFLVGVQPKEPGFRKILIYPQPGPLKHFSSKVPTPHGAVSVFYEADGSGSRNLRLTVPHPIEVELRLRFPNKGEHSVSINDERISITTENNFAIKTLVAGTYRICY